MAIEIGMNPGENAATSRDVNPAMLARLRSHTRAARMSGIDAMANAYSIESRAAVRADLRKAMRISQTSLVFASLSAPDHLDAAVVASSLETLDVETEDEDAYAPPSEAEKTMTVRSAAIVLIQSILGGGGCSLRFSFISVRL